MHGRQWGITKRRSLYLKDGAPRSRDAWKPGAVRFFFQPGQGCGQSPPQSFPVSVPFCAPSLHAAGWHLPA